MNKKDLFGGLVIGFVAGTLFWLIGRSLALPSGFHDILPYIPVALPIAAVAGLCIASFLGRFIPVLYQFSKFLLVGGSNFLIDLGVLNFLINATDVSQGAKANLFKAISFLVAVVWSFFWNKFWTFSSVSAEGAGKQFWQFLLVTVIGFFINLGVFALLNDVVGPRGNIEPKTWASVAAIGASIVGLLWNFVGYKLFVFRREA
jgi:putative flippase GtrA